MINNDNKTKIVLGILGTIILLATIAAIVILVVMPGIREAQEEKELQAKEAEIIEEIMELDFTIKMVPDVMQAESMLFIESKGGATNLTKEDFKRAYELSEKDIQTLSDAYDNINIILKEVEQEEKQILKAIRLSETLREIPKEVEAHLEYNKDIYTKNVEYTFEYYLFAKENLNGMKSLREQFKRLSK